MVTKCDKDAIVRRLAKAKVKFFNNLENVFFDLLRACQVTLGTNRPLTQASQTIAFTHRQKGEKSPFFWPHSSGVEQSLDKR
jgi:inosine-uridine nucleoside N-ribohydrolase